ncbi:hypothetical protein GM921_03730 [Pedobacter sp. LMG 31464]|uniref:ParB/Sulfiredoxin domain-containing protein n=1 Tax=Pedobacter planticolens TaxID=2679964 RepID=A0A923DWW0_9SPHI|nr:hypothetical protein [Pedobacter planticolens]MBB2144580.1 hypothetical protein [Pedobacter planticolens]
MNKDQRIIELDKIKSSKQPYKYDDIIYRGEKKLMPVYEINLDYLVYNKYNGRILSMVKSFERQFRNLNPEILTDKKVIEDFLWDSKPDRNRTTMTDLRDYGQKRVGIVTRDGIIIDGNRRSSLINRIANEDNRYPAYFKAIILDDTLDDSPQEIMRLETSYQMGEDEKLDYNPIEKYLKCKDLIEVGFSPGNIAEMMGEKEPRVNEWLSIMKLMDNYLNDLGYEGIYTRLDKREGQFVDLDKYLKKYDSGTAMVDWAYAKSDISDLKAICFDYIRAQYEGKEFRAIATPSKKESFFCKEKVWNKFKEEHFKNIDPINEKEFTVDELREKEPEGDLSEILKVRDADWTNATRGLLKGNLNKSQRLLDDVNEENSPMVLLRRAKDTLSSVNTELEAFYRDENVLTIIKEINKISWDFQQVIKKKNK